MALEIFGCYRESVSIRDKCKEYQSYHAVIIMDDGTTVDGIIENINGDEIIMLVGEDVLASENDQSRQPPGGYNRPNRYRRFRCRNYPIRGINRIGLLPYPYIPPVYTFPYGYPYYPIF